jgi:hypothetical protein
MKHWFLSFILSCLIIVSSANAGSLEAPAAPEDPASAMYTLESIYKLLKYGTTGTKRTGAFKEPTSGPTSSTGNTLNEVYDTSPKPDNYYGAQPEDVKPGKYFWGLRTNVSGVANSGWGLLTGTGGTYDAPVLKTGQNDSNNDYASWGKSGKDDAYWACPEKDNSGNCINDVGVGWDGAGSRFLSNGDDTVTDQLTGLMWTKKPNMGRNANNANTTVQWTDAFTSIDHLNDPTNSNSLPLGCSTNSEVDCYTDWRLPNIKELQSLIDFGQMSPALPPGYNTSFDDASMNYYWSSTSNLSNPIASAWAVYMVTGMVNGQNKGNPCYVWPVRRGKN